MTTIMTIIICLAIFIGIIFKYVLFCKREVLLKDLHFFTSEYFLAFAIEIITMVISCIIGIKIAHWDENNKEKENIICILEQTNQFSYEQYRGHAQHFEMYENEDISINALAIATNLNMNYYENILADQAIIKNVDMHAYGNIMRYIDWINSYNKLCNNETADDETRLSDIKIRDAYYCKLMDALDICLNDLNGEYTDVELIDAYNELATKELTQYIYIEKVIEK